jgi:hypothetical protein
VWMRIVPLHDSMKVMDQGNHFHQQNAHNVSSEPFGTGRNDSEVFRTLPNESEQVGTVPNLSEELARVEKYALTVREVARMFEEAGVPRTERSITKWCAPNPHGAPRLMCQFEPNEHRWLITEESARLAIAEEIAKQRELEARSAQAPEHPTPGEGHTDEPREEVREEQTNARMFERTTFREEAADPEKDRTIRELAHQLRTEQIASRAKDQVIERMQEQHMHLLDQVAMWSRQVGVLETKILQIEGPKERHGDTQPSVNIYDASDVPNRSEPFRTARG